MSGGDDGYDSTMDFTGSSEYGTQPAQSALKTVSNAEPMDTEHEELDPRIKGKLEELNQLTNKINQLEKKFEVSLSCS